MSSQSSGGAPVLYEDRTLFPSPVQEQPEPPRRERAGLSAAGVLLVAALAAAVAAIIVWFVISAAGTGATTSPELEELREQNAELQRQIDSFKESAVADQIQGLEDQVASLTADLEARIDASARYRELENLEADIQERRDDIDELLAEPERQRMPDGAKEIDAVPTWIADAEKTLRDYLDYLNERVEQVTTWPARNPLPPCNDPENC
ncbi:coiled-coil domain-containing protein [Henriciella aquimarina]|uniref:hypothetical protein n=1 Tax=Henriciella aquimarina TaxID=545261 RepID=UPI000A052D51|nr:hypothetical protein [Henriciella aquimarina]